MKRPAAKTLADLTEKDFRAYEKVRARGRFNMIAESLRAMSAAGLDEATYYGIQDHYAELMEKYPEVRKE